ncbi:MAG: AsmA-like C-terminal region-containing protein [Bacteroidota bacterium]
MRKKWWKYLLGVLLILVALVSTAIFWVYRNQESLLQNVLTEMNQAQPGNYVIDGSHIEFLKTFPYISIDLENLAFYANDSLNKVPIYQFEDVYVGFSFWKLLKGKIDIKRILVENGTIDIIHYKDGNWNLLQAKNTKKADNTKGTEENAALQLDLQEISLKNIIVRKTDLLNKQLVVLKIEESEAGISLQQDSLVAHLESKLTLEKLETDGSTIFQDKHLTLHYDLSYHLAEQWLRLKKSNFELEEAEFFMEGDIDIANEMDMDLRVYGRKPDFKLLLSLAPNDYYEKLKEYRNEGDVYFTGRILGKAANSQMPRIDLEFGCKNAYFVQTEKEKRLEDLGFRGYFTNGKDQSLETSELIVENLKGKPGGGVFAGKFKIKNFKKPYLLIDLHADIDLKDMSELLDIESFPDVSGQLLIDMTIDEVFDINTSTNLLKKLKDTIYAKVVMKDLNFKLADYTHPFEGVNGEIFWNGGDLELKNFSGKINNSDWKLTGKLTNLASIIHGENDPVEAQLRLKSKRLGFAEILPYDSTLSTQTEEVLSDLYLSTHINTTVNHLLNFKHLPQGEFFIDTLSCKMQGYAHALKNFHTDLLIDSSKLLLKDLSGVIDQSDLMLTAEVENYPALFDTTQLNRPVAWKMDFRSGFLSFQDLFTYKGKNPMPREYQQEVLRALSFSFHGNSTNGGLLHTKGLPQLQLELDALNGKFTFHKMPLRDFHAMLKTEQQDLHIQEFRGKVGRSDFEITGLLTNLVGEDTLGIQGNLQLNGNTLDLDELMAYDEEEEKEKAAKYGASYHDSTENLFTVPFPALNFSLDLGHLSYHKYKLDKLKAKGRLTPNHLVYLDTLQMLTADGAVGLKGYFNGSNPDSIYVKSDLYLAGLALDKISYKMDNFGTDYAFNETLHGKVYGKISSVARLHADFTPYLEGSEAHMDVKILDRRLENFPPMDMMAEYFGENKVKNIRFGELSNVFDFKDNQLSIPKMEISSTLGFINISGKQSMDLNMDYYIQVPFKVIGKAVKNSLFGVKDDKADEQEIISNEGKNRLFLNVRVSGNPDEYDIELKKARNKKDES